MAINVSVDGLDNYSVTVEGENSVLAIVQAFIGINCGQVWRSVLIDFTHAVHGPSPDPGDVMVAFQDVENFFGEEIAKHTKPIAMVPPLDPQARESFDSFYTSFSNFFEWAVREPVRLIRKFATMDEAKVWLEEFDQGHSN
ncbi:MAG: hypothetical protein AAF541_13410 [Pseudomonadota bacterium]